MLKSLRTNLLFRFPLRISHFTLRILILLSLSASELWAEPVATITVHSGSYERVDTPVSVELPAAINAWRPIQLQELKDDSRVGVSAQVEAGESRLLWFVLDGRTPANSSRSYELSYAPAAAASNVEMNLTSQALEVRVKGSRLFRYNHSHVLPPTGVEGEFIRSGYIHPMFSPSGKLVTEDFPPDHRHHKGVWFAWTKTKFEGHAVDFWNLKEKQGTIQFAGFELFENGPVYGRFRVNHEFVDLTQKNGGKIALRENWDVRVWAVGGQESGYWLWDLTSTQRCASESPLHLEKYRYGGLGFRGAAEWKGDNYRVLSSAGKTKKDGHTTRAKWCAHSGTVDGRWCTVAILNHPNNERFPESMRIWATGGAFFNYAPVQLGDWVLEPGSTYVLRYRFFVHDGEIDAKTTGRVWTDFGEPPTARLTLR